MSNMKRFCEELSDHVSGSPFSRSSSDDYMEWTAPVEVDGIISLKRFNNSPKQYPFDPSRLSPSARAILEKCKAVFKPPVFPQDLDDAIVMAGL